MIKEILTINSWVRSMSNINMTQLIPKNIFVIFVLWFIHIRGILLLLNHVCQFSNSVQYFLLVIVLLLLSDQGVFNNYLFNLCFVNLLDILIIISIIVRSCDNVLKLIYVLKGIISQMPIINDESKMVSHSGLRSNFRPHCKGVTHYSNQHIQHVDDQQESWEC